MYNLLFAYDIKSWERGPGDEANSLQCACVCIYFNIQNKDLFNSNEVCLSAFKDVSSILCHPKSYDSHVTRALSDVHKLLGLAKVQLKSTSQGKEIDLSIALGAK